MSSIDDCLLNIFNNKLLNIYVLTKEKKTKEIFTTVKFSICNMYVLLRQQVWKEKRNRKRKKEQKERKRKREKFWEKVKGE